MQSVIGALRVNLGLDSASFISGAKDSKAALFRLRDTFAAVSAAAGALGTALGAMTVQTINSAKEIDRLSYLANTTPETFQRWAAAAKTVGIEQDKLSDILKDTNDRVGDFLAGEGGEMKDFFDLIAPKVGVTAEMFRGLSGPEALQLYVSSLEKANVSQAEMTFYMEAVADEATGLVPLLRDGGAEMARLGGAADEFGAVLTSKAIRSLKQTGRAISEVGLVLEGFRNRIALALAPTIEAMARGFSDLAREGQPLNVAIKAVAENINRLLTYVGTAVAVIGGRFVFALAAARLATLTLAGSLKLLWAAMLRTGFGILIVGAGEMVYQFGRLVSAAGGFGEALRLMGAVAAEVWERIRWGSRAAGDAFGMLGAVIRSKLLGALAVVAEAGRDFAGWFGLEIGEGVAGALREMATEAQRDAKMFRDLAQSAAEYAGRPLESLRALRAALAAAGDEGETTAGSLDRVNAEIAETDEKADKASKKTQKLKDSLKETAKAGETVADRVSDAFGRMTDSIISGASSAKDIVLSLIADLAKIGINDFLKPMLNSALSTAFASDLAPKTSVVPMARPTVPGFASGTDYAPGGMAVVGEEGPELLNIPRGSRITPNNELGNLGGTTYEIHVDARGSSNPAEVEAAGRRGAEAALTQVRPIVHDMKRRGEI